MRVLFLENEDSFSWNVIDRLPCGRDEVEIVPGREAAACPERLAGADVLVVGPGPTDPERAGLVGVVRAAAARRLPTLGICLGHQAIGLAFGARLVRTPPRHGKPSVATFSGARLFAAFAGPQTVMRYHSLALADVVRPLRVVATSEDGVVMAVEHEELPLAGSAIPPGLVRHTPRGRDDRRLLPGARVRLADLEALPAFAFLGPGFGGGRAVLLTGLRPASGAPRLLFAPFETRGRDALLLDGEIQPGTRSNCLRRPTSSRDSMPPGTPKPWSEIREAIAAGDVYQVCLTVRARLAPVSGAALFARMAARGLPRFAAWVRLPGGVEFVSASPELLFEIEGGGSARSR